MKEDTSTCYCVEGSVGPATLRAWRGKLRQPTIPVAWVEIGKAYLSYHLMSLYAGDDSKTSKALKARMQGKTCFNLKSRDQALFQELDQLTGQGINGFRKAGFIGDGEPVSANSSEQKTAKTAKPP